MRFRLPQLALAATVALCWTGAAWAHCASHAGHQPAVRAPEQTPWGIAAREEAAPRTIEVRMTDDMRFTPDRVTVRQGEAVRFVVHNQGTLLHEMVIGTNRALQEHAAMMIKFPDMEHDEPFMTHVNPGEDGSIVWNFNRAGQFQFACLVAGHYQAGMFGTVTVIPAGKQNARN